VHFSKSESNHILFKSTLRDAVKSSFKFTQNGSSQQFAKTFITFYASTIQSHGLRNSSAFTVGRPKLTLNSHHLTLNHLTSVQNPLTSSTITRNKDPYHCSDHPCQDVRRSSTRAGRTDGPRADQPGRWGPGRVIVSLAVSASPGSTLRTLIAVHGSRRVDNSTPFNRPNAPSTARLMSARGRHGLPPSRPWAAGNLSSRRLVGASFLWRFTADEHGTEGQNRRREDLAS
jgi:hypothetical protein